jgi:hypothetical protein
MLKTCNFAHSGKLSYYSQPPELEKPTDTKIVTEFAPAFNIDDLLKEETELFESMDDTKLIVDGIEIESSKSIMTNFEELEKDGKFLLFIMSFKVDFNLKNDLNLFKVSVSEKKEVKLIVLILFLRKKYSVIFF